MVAVLTAVLLRTFVVETFFIPSGSMIPTLGIGDRILVDRLPFATDHLARGQVVVFRRVAADTDPQHPADLVKRVIGLPGETIWSVGDRIYIDGRPLAEPWLPSLAKDPPSALCGQSAYAIPRTTIPKGHYFVMGDCRGNSLDSRSWGTVPQANVVGEVFVIVWRSGHPWFHWL